MKTISKIINFRIIILLLLLTSQIFSGQDRNVRFSQFYSESIGILNSASAYTPNDDIYIINSKTKDLKSFRLILNYDYFQSLNDNTPYRLYQKIWNLDNREYEMGSNDSTIVTLVPRVW